MSNIFSLIKLNPIRKPKKKGTFNVSGRHVKYKRQLERMEKRELKSYKRGHKELLKEQKREKSLAKKRDFLNSLLTRNDKLIQRNVEVSKEQFKQRTKDTAMRRYIEKQIESKAKKDGKEYDKSQIRYKATKYIEENLSTKEKRDEFFKQHETHILTQKNIRESFKERIYSDPYLTTSDKIMKRILFGQMGDESRKDFISFFKSNNMSFKDITIEKKFQIDENGSYGKNVYVVSYKGKETNFAFAYLNPTATPDDPLEDDDLYGFQVIDEVQESIDKEYYEKEKIKKVQAGEDEKPDSPLGFSFLRFINVNDLSKFDVKDISSDDDE